MSTQMASYRAAGEQAAKAEQASLKSAAEAKNAAEQAAAVRAGLQKKQSELQVQIAVVKSQYASLTPQQRQRSPTPGRCRRWRCCPMGRRRRLHRPVRHRRTRLRRVRLRSPQECPGSGMPGFPGPAPSGDRATVVQAALTQVGSSYVWGGAAPGGFDCSGLVMWAFQQAGISLPHSSQAHGPGRPAGGAVGPAAR